MDRMEERNEWREREGGRNEGREGADDTELQMKN